MTDIQGVRSSENEDNFDFTLVHESDHAESDYSLDFFELQLENAVQPQVE
jgi:hypothetical protein